MADKASDEYKKSTGRKLGKDATIAAAVGGGLVAISAVGVREPCTIGEWCKISVVDCV